MPPPQINLQELYGMQKKKKQNRLLCFDHIIELCHRRIRTVASYSGQNTFYEIPGIVVGYPLYNLNECIAYVVASLRNNGFLVQVLPPPHIGVIYISWDPRELVQSNNTHAKQIGYTPTLELPMSASLLTHTHSPYGNNNNVKRISQPKKISRKNKNMYA